MPLAPLFELLNALIDVIPGEPRLPLARLQSGGPALAPCPLAECWPRLWSAGRRPARSPPLTMLAWCVAGDDSDEEGEEAGEEAGEAPGGVGSRPRTPPPGGGAGGGVAAQPSCTCREGWVGFCSIRSARAVRARALDRAASDRTFAPDRTASDRAASDRAASDRAQLRGAWHRRVVGIHWNPCRPQPS